MCKCTQCRRISRYVSHCILLFSSELSNYLKLSHSVLLIFKGFIVAIVLLSAHAIAELGEHSSTTRPRSAKTTKTTSPSTTPSSTTVSEATQSPSSTRQPPLIKATHKPFPYDQHGPRATHAPFPPRSTYAPYVYGMGDGDSAPAKKKTSALLSAIDKDTFTTWARDLIAYIAAPFLVPAAIQNAFNTPAGLAEQASLWGKIARSFRMAILRRSEDRDSSDVSESLPNEDAHHVLLKMKNKLKSSKIWQQLKERRQKEKKERLLPSRLVDFLRLKRHRTSENSPVAAISPSASSLVSET